MKNSTLFIFHDVTVKSDEGIFKVCSVRYNYINSHLKTKRWFINSENKKGVGFLCRVF